MKRSDRKNDVTLITDPGVVIPGYVPGWSQQSDDDDGNTLSVWDTTWSGVEARLNRNSPRPVGVPTPSDGYEDEQPEDEQPEQFDYSAGVWHPFKSYRHDASNGNKRERISATYTPLTTLAEDAEVAAARIDAERLRQASGQVDEAGRYGYARAEVVQRDNHPEPWPRVAALGAGAGAALVGVFVLAPFGFFTALAFILMAFHH